MNVLTGSNFKIIRITFVMALVLIIFSSISAEGATRDFNVKCDKETYVDIAGTSIICEVTNNKTISETADVFSWFPKTATIENISVLITAPRIKTINDYGNCTDKICGNKTCIDYEYECLLGTYQEQVIEDRWVPLEFEHQKSLSEGYGVRDMLFTSKEIMKFKIDISYPINSKGKFNVTAGDFELDPWWNSSWDRCRNLTIRPTNIDSNLVDMPILMVLNSTNINYSLTQDQGQDIRIINTSCGENGTEVPHVIERWNESDNSYVFFRGNPNAANNVTYSYYYNNSLVPDNSDPYGVWSNGYYMVHLLNHTSGTVFDALNNVNGTAENNPIYNVTGQIDGAMDFTPNDAGGDQNVNLGDWDLSSQDITMMAWINGDDLGLRPQDVIASKFDPDPANGDDWIFYLIGRELYHEVYQAGAVWTQSRTTTANIPNNQWYHVAAVLDDENPYQISLFINGTSYPVTVASGGGGADSIQNSSVPARIGRRERGGANSRGFDGTIDYYTTAYANRTEPWIKAQYYSGRNDLLLYGPEEQLPAEFTLNYTSPTFPNNTVSNYTYLFINVSSGLTIDTCVLNWTYESNFTSINITATVGGQYCFANVTSLIEDTYIFYMWGNDTTPLSNTTGYRHINVSFLPGPAIPGPSLIYKDILHIGIDKNMERYGTVLDDDEGKVIVGSPLLFNINTFTLIPQSSAPLNPNFGEIYYDLPLDAHRYYNGTGWNLFGNVTPTTLNASSVTRTANVGEAGGIDKGQVVYILDATGDKPRVLLASNQLHNNSHALGVAIEDKNFGDEITIMLIGELRDLDTTMYYEGCRLHLATGGNMSCYIQPNGSHIHLGFATKININTGILEIKTEDYIHDIQGTLDLNVSLGGRAVNITNRSRDTIGYFDLDNENNRTFHLNGNITIDTYRGEMYNYTSNATAYLFDIDAANVYYNLTDLSTGDLNGFIHTNASQASGGSYLTAQVPGLYSISLSASIEASQATALYSLVAARNGDATLSRNCYSRRTLVVNNVGSTSVTCVIRMNIGDTMHIQIENEDNNRDIEVHTINLNLMRIGN